MEGDDFDSSTYFASKLHQVNNLSEVDNEGEISQLPEQVMCGLDKDYGYRCESEQTDTCGTKRKRNYPTERRVNSMKASAIPGVQGFILRENMKELKQNAHAKDLKRESRKECRKATRDMTERWNRSLLLYARYGECFDALEESRLDPLRIHEVSCTMDVSVNI